MLRLMVIAKPNLKMPARCLINFSWFSCWKLMKSSLTHDQRAVSLTLHDFHEMHAHHYKVNENVTGALPH